MMNENIAEQLTDMHKNKEQFVHEITEVYLLLKEEFEKITPKETAAGEDIDIPDMSAVRLDNSIVGNSGFKAVAVPREKHTDVSINAADKIEISLTVPNKTSYNNFSVPNIISSQLSIEHTVSVPEKQVSLRNISNENYTVKSKAVINTLETGKFEYNITPTTAVAPKKLVLEQTAPDGIATELQSSKSNITVTAVKTPSYNITFPEKMTDVTSTSPNSITVAEKNIELHDINGSVNIKAAYGDELKIGLPSISKITGNFSIDTDSSISLNNECTQIVLHTTEKIISTYDMMNPTDTSVRSSSVPISDYKIAVPDITGNDITNINIKSQAPNVVSVSDEFGVIPTVSTKPYNNVKLSIPKKNANVVVPSGVTDIAPVKIDGNIAHTQIDRNVLFVDPDESGIAVSYAYPKSSFGQTITMHTDNAVSQNITENINDVPIKFPEINTIKLSDKPEVAAVSQTVCVPSSDVNLTGNFDIPMPQFEGINAEYPSATFETVLTYPINIRIDGMPNMADYINSSYNKLKKTMANTKNTASETHIRKTPDKPHEINVDFPDVAGYSREILDSLKRQILGA